MIWNDIKYFRPHEFDSPDAPGSGFGMSLPFVRKLDKLRDAVNMPLIVVSGYRTEIHNAKVGGVDSSAHERGQAVDIRALSSQTKFRILEAAFKLGFRRIGIGSTFVHIDDSITHPQDVVWTYPANERKS